MERLAAAKLARAEKLAAANDKPKAIRELKEFLTDPSFVKTAAVVEVRDLRAKLENEVKEEQELLKKLIKPK